MKKRLRELGLFSLEKGRLRWHLINAYRNLKGGCKEGRDRLFSVVPSNRTKSSGHKLKYRKFCMNIRNHFFTVRVMEHCNRFPRQVVESVSLELFGRYLDMFLVNQL